MKSWPAQIVVRENAIPSPFLFHFVLFPYWSEMRQGPKAPSDLNNATGEVESERTEKMPYRISRIRRRKDGKIYRLLLLGIRNDHSSGTGVDRNVSEIRWERKRMSSGSFYEARVQDVEYQTASEPEFQGKMLFKQDRNVWSLVLCCTTGCMNSVVQLLLTLQFGMILKTAWLLY